MKKLIYLAILALIISMVVSKDFREKILRSTSIAKDGVERLVFRGDYLTVSVVDDDNFDNVILKPGRVVIIYFQHEMTSVAKTQSAAFESKMKDFPAKVLLGKVQAERNEVLLERLGIDQIPTVRVYREGKLLKEYEAPLNEDAIVDYVESLLEN